MPSGKRVFRTHATMRTETRGAGTGYEFRSGIAFCDPKDNKKTPPSAANDWRGSIGTYAPADQPPADFFKANCPDCAKAWGKQQLAHLGDRVRFEPFDKSSFKSISRVYLDGAFRAIIGIRKGFGNKWMIFRARAQSDRDLQFGYDLDGIGRESRYRDGQLLDTELHELHFSARDALASQIARLTDDGWLPTIEEQAAEKAAAEERRAAEARQRQIEADERARQREIDAENREKARIEREAERALAIDALESLLGDERRHLLSNSEIAGLEAAKKLLGAG